MRTAEPCLDRSGRHTVALFIPSLDIGGAERQLLELAKGLDKTRWNVLILSNSINRMLASEINSVAGIKVILLDKKSRLLYPFRLLEALVREKPCIVNPYLLSAQTYALLVRLFLPRFKVVFSVRDSSAYHGLLGRFYRLFMEKSSWLVDRYIFNSVSGRNARRSLPDSRVHIIPNGIDTDAYSPDNGSPTFVRREAGIDDNAPVVGIVGNISSYKGYETFIWAARKATDLVPGTHFVAIGNYDTALGPAMLKLVDDLGLTASFHFMGARRDVPKLLPGFNLFCSSSVTEGFSNAICESMSCGVPCVVTDVGDSAFIVGDTGVVVPPSDPDSLAEGIVKLLRLTPAERLQLGSKARSRIEENFGIPRMVAATEKVYDLMLGSR